MNKRIVLYALTWVLVCFLTAGLVAAYAGTNADDGEKGCQEWAYWAQYGASQALRGKPATLYVLPRGAVLEMFGNDKELTVDGFSMWSDEATPAHIEAVTYGYGWVRTAKDDEIPENAAAATEMFYQVCLARVAT